MSKEQRSELLRAIADCEHSMTDGRVTLHFDRSKPGNNALHQLANRIEAALASPAAEPGQATPSSRWRVEGEPDPHAGHYDGERAALTLGYLTDDELANGAFMNYDRRLDLGAIGKPGYHSPIAWMTAVKDRIRWLSRALDRALASPPATKEAKAGWKLVPVTPTQEMNDAGLAALVTGNVPLVKVYRAMLAAAPEGAA